MKCEICGANPPVYVCKSCGRKVCKDDYDQKLECCIACREATCEICSGHLSVGVCKYCRRLGCEWCLVQVSPIEYVCIKCYVKYSPGGESAKSR